MNELIEFILSNTVFLAKTLDLFEGFKVPGKDYKILACQASEELVQKYQNIYVDEIIKGQRHYSTSTQFLDIMQNSVEFKKYLDCKHIWTYQAYSWTNDLRYSGKIVFCIDYFLFLKLHNKLIQRKLLIEHASLTNEYTNLKKNLINSSILLATRIFPKQEVEYDKLKKTYNNAFVVCASNSNGGDSIFKISTENEYLNAIKSIVTPVIRTEKYIENGIPLNQIGFVLSNGVIIKYRPSVQIIKNIHQSNKMEYAGCDFSDSHLNDSEILANITELTHDIGKILYQIGYRGTFGCDYVVVDDTIHFIELNPRYQASTLIPNIHLGEHDLLAPHILHILGFADVYCSTLNQYNVRNIFVDFIQSGKPIGFYNIYNEKIDKIRKPNKTVIIQEGVSKGYLLFTSSIIDNPFYPAEINLVHS